MTPMPATEAPFPIPVTVVFATVYTQMQESYLSVEEALTAIRLLLVRHFSHATMYVGSNLISTHATEPVWHGSASARTGTEA